MKFGYRTPSFKKSLSARTKGRMTRQIKGAFNPYYGKKGMGWINNPKKAAYNAVYHRTTRSIYSRGSRGGRSSKSDPMATLLAIIGLAIFAVLMATTSNFLLAIIVAIGVATYVGVKLSKQQKKQNDIFKKIREDYQAKGGHVYVENTKSIVVPIKTTDGKVECSKCHMTFEGNYNRCPVCRVRWGTYK